MFTKESSLELTNRFLLDLIVFPIFKISRFVLTREESLKCIVDNLHDKDVVVATTGMLSRELFEYRVSKCQGHEKDFLCVGSMGHASAIALGIAKKKRNRQVINSMPLPGFYSLNSEFPP